MKHFAFVISAVISALLTLSSCVPATEQLPVAPAPVSYEGAQEEVYETVLQTISDSPGVPSYNPGGLDGYERGPSGPWVLTSSNPPQSVSAQTESSASGFLGSNAEPDVHEIDVRLSEIGEGQTRVSVQGTPQAQGLAEVIYARLDERFGRLE